MESIHLPLGYRSENRIDFLQAFCSRGRSAVEGKIDLLLFVSHCEQSDSEYMAGQLSAYGYVLTDIPALADLWLVNT